MKPIIETHPNAYGFGHDWTLTAFGRTFYLGQDTKFCRRVLGMTGRQVADRIGTNDLRGDKARQDLAALILETFNLDETSIRNLQPWELCAQ